MADDNFAVGHAESQADITSDYVELIHRAGWTGEKALGQNTTGQSSDVTTEYHAQGAVFEWNDEYGDVAPEIPELEKLLFDRTAIVGTGEHMQNLVFEVDIEGPQKIEHITEFGQAPLHPVVLDNIKKCGYYYPTTIQKYTIPAILMGSDVVAISQTGSGKTSAYMIPVISKLMGKAKKLAAPKPDAATYNVHVHWVRAEPLVVVVVPTRELAMQIFDEARRMCYRSMLRPCVIYGGLPTRMMYEDLGKGCDVLVATPGRICDLMDQPDRLTMNRVKYTIIDEADELLNDDWDEELRKIMGGGGKYNLSRWDVSALTDDLMDNNDDADHVFLMFSATFPKTAREIARQYMNPDYTRIRVGRAGSSHKNIKQDIILVDQDKKREAIFDLLMSREPSRTLIFCNSKKQVDLLDDFLYNRGLPTTSIHSERHQREREDSIRNFRTGRTPILVATGISARGWDVPGVNHVINYDLPSAMYGGIQEYIHRIGRTARIGHLGVATSFYNDGNEDIAQDLVNVLVECESEVPEFLSHLTPEDGRILFDDDSADEGEASASTVGQNDGWGGDEEPSSKLESDMAEQPFVPDQSAAVVTAGGW